MIETARLLLRTPTEADLQPWGALLADADVMRFLGGPQVRPIEWLRLAMIRAWRPPQNGMLSVVEKSSGSWIGRIGLWCPEGWPGIEIGWTLSRAAWGKGYATEGAAAAMDWAVGTMGLTEIIHVIKPDNEAAISVARRLGSRRLRTETLRPPHSGALVEIWGQTKSEWSVNRLMLSGSPSVRDTKMDEARPSAASR